MKPSPSIRRHRRGFTLVELLVVVAIIIVLAGLSLAGIKKIQLNARKADARNVCTQFDQGITSFYDDYNYLPYGGGTAPTNDPALPGIQTQDNDGMVIVQTLLGYDQGDAAVQNPKRIQYVKLNEIHTQTSNKSGVRYTNTTPGALIDPWMRSFYVMLDYDYDKVMEDPLRGNDARIRGRHSATYSLGENNQANGGLGDDVCTW